METENGRWIMARKKVKWIVSWWDYEKDCEVHALYDTHELAVTRQFKLQKRGISATVTLK